MPKPDLSRPPISTPDYATALSRSDNAFPSRVLGSGTRIQMTQAKERMLESNQENVPTEFEKRSDEFAGYARKRSGSCNHHSHSIILSHDNALNYQGKFLRSMGEHRPPNPSEICALDVKSEFRRSAICSASATIDIDRPIFANQCRDHRLLSD
jgi:hypothetical protein